MLGIDVEVWFIEHFVIIEALECAKLHMYRLV